MAETESGGSGGKGVVRTTNPYEDKKKPRAPTPGKLERQVQEALPTKPTQAERARREPHVPAPAERREIRQALLVKDMKPYVSDKVDKEYKKQLGPQYTSLGEDEQARLVATATQTYLSQVSTRAARLTPGLMRENPLLAADILLSGIPTEQVTEISEAAFDGFRSMRAEYMRKQAEHAAGLAPTEANVVGLLMEHLERTGVPLGAGPGGGFLGYTPPGEEASGAEQAVSAAGFLLSAPFKAGGVVGGAALRTVGAEGIAEEFGMAARVLETEIGNAVRVAEGAALSVATLNPKYLQGWGDAEEGRMGPASEIFFDITGFDPEEYRGLQQAIDLAVDLGFTEGVLRTAAAVKRGRTTPHVKYSGEEFYTKTRPGRGTVDALWEQRQVSMKAGDATARADLMNRSKGVTPTIAEAVAKATTRDDVRRALAGAVDEVPTVELRALEQQLKGVKGELVEISRAKNPTHFRASTRNLQAQRISLEQRILEMRNREPVFTFPRASHIHPFMRGVPQNTWVARTLQQMFSETKVLDLSKIFEEATTRRTPVYDPVKSTGRPRNWMEHNVAEFRKRANIAKVPKGEQNALIEALFNITTDQQFFLWMESVERAFLRGVGRGGKRSLDLVPEANSLMRFSTKTLEERITAPVERTATLPDGSTVKQVRNALEDGGQPIPTEPKDFLGHSYFPDIGMLQDVSSSVRYFDRYLKTRPGVGKIYGQLSTTVDTAKLVGFALPRMILRPALLDTRILPMGVKILADDALRARLMGYRKPLWRRKKVDYGPSGMPSNPTTKELLGDDGRSALGHIAETIYADTETVATRVSTRGLHPGMDEWGQVINSRAGRLAEMAGQEFSRKLALFGPEDMLRYLTDHPDSSLGRWYREVYKPYLDARKIAPETWLREKSLEIDQFTGGDPALRRGIATKEWDVQRPAETGATMNRELLLNELDEARAALRETEAGIPRRELNSHIEVLEERLGRAEAQVTGTTKIKVTDVDEVANEIGNRWSEGRFQMPDEVIVRRQVARGTSTTADMTRRQRLRAYGQRVSATTYKPLGLLSRLPGREATWRQVHDRVYQDLVGRGWKPQVAKEIAHERATFIAKDLHYEISARSSFDRKMRDYFWFSPVWREQMTTYLYKIPSRHYWPVGFTMRTHQAYSILDALHEFGLLEWDEVTFEDKDTGELQTSRNVVLNVPWITDFIQKVSKNEEAGRINVEGMNPITPGTTGILPTLSPGAESILDFTAKQVPPSMRGFFEIAADLFTFDQDPGPGGGPNWIPTPIISAMELFGIHAPFDTLNLDGWREAERKANVQALTWSMADLAEEGIMPPGEDATDAEIERYKDRMIENAHRYEFTLGIFHVIGSAILPGRFTQRAGVTDAGQRFYDAREAIGELPSEEFFEWQNNYLRKNPEAFPYSVGRHPGQYGTPSYDDTKTLEPADFIDKALAQTHYWMDKDPNDPDVPEGERENIARKQGERNVVLFAADPAGAELQPEDLDTLGLPDFSGRDELVKRVNGIYKRFGERYSSEMSDEDKAALYAARDGALDRAAAGYGSDGERILKFFRATPAERLRGADYFITQSSTLAIDEAQNIERAALAAGSSPMFAAESTGVLAAKVALYRQVERYRAHDAAFDREMRRAEVTLGEKDTTKGRVALYEWIFFGQPDNLFGYQSEIVRALNG